MPLINLGGKKPREKNQVKQSYQHIYNNKRWKRIRRAKVRQNPLCERCEKLGKVTPVQEVHHKKPFMQGQSQEEIEALAYPEDLDELESLCIECHKIVEKGAKI